MEGVEGGFISGFIPPFTPSCALGWYRPSVGVPGT